MPELYFFLLKMAKFCYLYNLSFSFLCTNINVVPFLRKESNENVITWAFSSHFPEKMLVVFPDKLSSSRLPFFIAMLWNSNSRSSEKNLRGQFFKDLLIDGRLLIKNERHEKKELRWDPNCQSHYMEVPQGGIFSRAMHNLLWLFSLHI